MRQNHGFIGCESLRWDSAGRGGSRREWQRLVERNNQNLTLFAFADIVAGIVILTFFAVEIVVVGDRNCALIEHSDAFDFFRDAIDVAQIEDQRFWQDAHLGARWIGQRLEGRRGLKVIPLLPRRLVARLKSTV